jgi:hypothetical protein
MTDRDLKPPNEADLLDLLRKLAAGDGGRRTGELKRRGWLEWRVTPAGQAELANHACAVGPYPRYEVLVEQRDELADALSELVRWCDAWPHGGPNVELWARARRALERVGSVRLRRRDP